MLIKEELVECQYFMGLVSMFKSFFRWIAPIVKTHAVPVMKDAAKFVRTEAIKTAANITSDAIDGKDLNKSIKDRAEIGNLTLETIGNLSDKVTNVIQKGGETINYKKRKICSKKKHNLRS